MKFHEILVHSYDSGYLKTLDADFFFSLKSPMAKSLYQLLDAKRRGKLSWTVRVQQLRQLIPMPEKYRYMLTIVRVGSGTWMLNPDYS